MNEYEDILLPQKLRTISIETYSIGIEVNEKNVDNEIQKWRLKEKISEVLNNRQDLSGLKEILQEKWPDEV